MSIHLWDCLSKNLIVWSILGTIIQKNKTYTSIDEPNHKDIAYLEEILIIFKEYHDNRYDKLEWTATSLYKSLCWLVYRMKGIATYLSEDN